MDLVAMPAFFSRVLAFCTEPGFLALFIAIIAPLTIGFIFSRKSSTTQAVGGTLAQSNSTSIMAPPRSDLEPPKSDPFTLEELRQFDGTEENRPIYVSIKGTVFDVSHKRDVYGPPNGSYRIFAGKDASKAFGLSSLKVEDATPDWSELEPKDRKTLDEWHAFFKKRYNVMGRISNMPDPVKQYVWPQPEQ